MGKAQIAVMSHVILHDYFRSSASYRVRIGLNLKGIEYRSTMVNLVTSEQSQAAYHELNPQGFVPLLEIDGHRLTQSLAILEYLDETHPEPALMPKDPMDRARVRAMAGVIACDIHPLNNMRVQRALEAMDVAAPRRAKWTERWIVDGFNTLEPMIAKYGQGFCFGDTPTIADCCLIPQIYSAARYKVELDAWPAIQAVGLRSKEHPAFIAALPENQPDAIPA